ncbi:MAG: hypothetical protein JWR69_828 [Pedosphaera sp.]|nr:hypothetical protein [Pedosphaera sp.]
MLAGLPSQFTSQGGGKSALEVRLKISPMQKCSYCGSANKDDVDSCSECGTDLSEPETPIILPTPHRAMSGFLQSIWEHFAVKRRQFYVAGFLIGALGGLVGTMRHAGHGFSWACLPAGGAMGVGAVWLLSFAEKLQGRIDRERAKGNPALLQQAVFVVLGLISLIVVTLLVGAVCVYLL